MLAYFDLDEAQLKQTVNARQIWTLLRQAEDRARTHAGNMRWREMGGREYLLKVSPRGRQNSLGRRDARTEAIYAAFTESKGDAERSLLALRAQFERQRRLNKALRVGTAPEIVIRILNAIERAGLADQFQVIGTHSMLAYEARAGVQFQDDLMATLDLDLLWDSRKLASGLKLCVSSEVRSHGVLGVLRQADKSFRLIENQKYSARAESGFMVDLIKPGGKDLGRDSCEPQQLVAHADDFWAVKIPTMDWLLSSPRFREIIIGGNGEMAEMHTVDPRAFTIYKAWMAKQPDRDPLKAKRDRAQAGAVYRLVNESMPQLEFPDLHAFPEAIRRGSSAAATVKSPGLG